MIYKAGQWALAVLAALSMSQSESLSVSNAPGVSSAWDWSAPLPVPALSGAELERSVRCLALNIYHEARSEPELGQRAVAAVTLNRVASGQFPGSVCGVVEQGGKGRNACQFSWRCDAASDRPREAAAWLHALDLSRKALSGLTADPTGGALYYHAIYVEPGWSQDLRRTARIGRHLFYKPGS
jgi:spore germination cell wall hydrolase CwlJ-like protein